MDVSPFPYYGPLPPHQVTGRDALLADLTERVTEHRVTALLGPRRFGKTTVLRRLAADLTEVDTVWVDLYAAATHADLAVRFAAALTRAGTPVASVADRLAVTAGINLGVVQAELARPARERPDAGAMYRELVELTAQTALRTPVLLVLDEFQSVSRIAHAAAVLRTSLQHHYADIGLVFAGSEPSLMRDLFTRDDEPFFGQADIVTIEPLTLAAVHDLVAAGFTRTKRAAGTIAGAIFELTGGHPQRTMMAADAAWRRTAVAATADLDVWAIALDDLRTSTASTLSARFVEFGTDQQKVLRLVAHGEALFGAGGERLQLSSGGGTAARDRLLAEGKLTREGRKLSLTDPLFADWIRHRFPR